MVEFRVPAGFRVDRTSGRTGTSQKGQRPDSCATAKGAYWIVGLAEQRERNCKPEAERLLGLGVLLQRQKVAGGGLRKTAHTPESQTAEDSASRGASTRRRWRVCSAALGKGRISKIKIEVRASDFPILLGLHCTMLVWRQANRIVPANSAETIIATRNMTIIILRSYFLKEIFALRS